MLGRLVPSHPALRRADAIAAGPNNLEYAMATTKHHAPGRTLRGLMLPAVGFAAAAGAFWLYVLIERPPQMGADERAFAAVEALHAVVMGHDDKLLGQCEQRLKDLADSEKLPKEAYSYLEGVINMCRVGQWDVAAKKLDAFMKAQRRDAGPDEGNN
jgi:hypothetical protein